MSVKSLKHSSLSAFSDGSTRDRAKFKRVAWACLPGMLALSAGVLLLFGFSWWTALGVALLLSCPASAAVAYYLGERRYTHLPEAKRDT